jgi:hypothetical protein
LLLCVLLPLVCFHFVFEVKRSPVINYKRLVWVQTWWLYMHSGLFLYIYCMSWIRWSRRLFFDCCNLYLPGKFLGSLCRC